ncbi:MAG: glucose-1-phosphate cytidylyltransferase [Allosphingosinicella sp.]
MKVVLLAGGLGSRLSEETHVRPKPMVEIGGHPILWHIMMHYSRYGFTDFIICLGYKGYVIKEYFANFVLHRSDVTVDLSNNRIEYNQQEALPPWRVTLVDTGADTLTGGRLKRIAHLLGDEPFCMTYGDGVSDVDLGRLVEFHHSQGLDATLTAVRPPGRYGATVLDEGRVTRFEEKPAGDGGRINGGFFVLHPRVIARIAGDETPWESEPLSSLAADGQLAAFVHDGFWQPMDTLRDRNQLEALWASGTPPWKSW